MRHIKKTARHSPVESGETSKAIRVAGRSGDFLLQIELTGDSGRHADKLRRAQTRTFEKPPLPSSEWCFAALGLSMNSYICLFQ